MRRRVPVRAPRPRPSGVDASSSVLFAASTGARWAALFGFLEWTVLHLMAPPRPTGWLFGTLIASPLIHAGVGALFGVLLGCVLALLRRFTGDRPSVLTSRGGVWALTLAGLVGFYWIFAVNALHPSGPLAPTALALDAVALAAALVLAFVIVCAIGRGLLRPGRQRWAIAAVLVLWLPIYLVAARPAMKRAIGPPPRRAELSHAGSVRPANLLLIIIDTTRSDCLGCYGSTDGLTPAIDRLAEESVLFEQCVTPEPLTRPAFCTMLTGLYPRTHGVDTNTKILGEAFETLAELLRERGYRTGAFVSTDVLNGFYGTDQGFEVYVSPVEPWWYLRSDFAIRRMYRSLTRRHVVERYLEMSAERVNGKVLPWIRRHADEPFFAIAHYYDPHAPYAPPAPFDLAAREGLADVPAPYANEEERFAPGYDMPDDFVRKQWLRYQGEIASMDGRIGELLNEIDGMGIADDTVVVLVADHGESFEHEYYFAHGSRLYDPLVHVPLMIRSPGRLAPRRVSAQVRLIDLCPTLLALIGAEGGPACQGEDFSGLARGTVCDESAADRIAFCQTDFEIVWPVVPKEQIAVRTPAWKYIESPTTGRVELYDLAADPAEVDDRAAQEVAVRDELESLLREWDATTESTDVSVESLTSQQTEALRALGYLR